MRTHSLFIILSLALVACGDDNPGTPADAGVDASLVDAGLDASCFTNPQTHAEILNACVTWQHVDKTPVTPLRNSDGSLPTLPP